MALQFWQITIANANCRCFSHVGEVLLTFHFSVPIQFLIFRNTSGRRKRSYCQHRIAEDEATTISWRGNIVVTGFSVKLSSITSESQTHAAHRALPEGDAASAPTLCHAIPQHLSFSLPYATVAFEGTLQKQLVGNIGSCHVPALQLRGWRGCLGWKHAGVGVASQLALCCSPRWKTSGAVTFSGGFL